MTVAAQREAEEINATDASVCQTFLAGYFGISHPCAKLGRVLQPYRAVRCHVHDFGPQRRSQNPPKKRSKPKRHISGMAGIGSGIATGCTSTAASKMERTREHRYKRRTFVGANAWPSR